MKEEEHFVNEKSENPDGKVAFLRSHSCIHHHKAEKKSNNRMCCILGTKITLLSKVTKNIAISLLMIWTVKICL